MSLADSVCAICSRPMIDTGYDHHPGCDHREGHLYRIDMGWSLGREGMARALAADPAARRTGLAIIRSAALDHEHLSADTVRQRLDDAHVPEKMRGGLWATAVSKGWVEKIAEAPSAGRSVHGKKINQYRSRLRRAA